MQKTILILFSLIMINPVSAAGFNDSSLGLNLSLPVSTTSAINASANTSANTSVKSDLVDPSIVGSSMVADGINLALTRMGNDITKHYGPIPAKLSCTAKSICNSRTPLTTFIT